MQIRKLAYVFVLLIIIVLLVKYVWSFYTLHPRLVEIEKITDIGTVPEQIIEITYWNNDIILAPYLSSISDRPLKIYGININEDKINIFHSSEKCYESVCRIWVSPSRNHLNFTTEQPPEHWSKSKDSKWILQKKYDKKGWALLGKALSNNEEVRGFSRPEYNGSIEKLTKNGWINLPIKRTKDGSSLIYWCMEYFNKKYYLGTSWAEDGGYNMINSGNIYSLHNNEWIPVFGHESENPCGRVNCSLAIDNNLFFGTKNPNQILIINKSAEWERFHITDEGTVGSIWKDDENHIFAGSQTRNDVRLYQWDYASNHWELIFTHLIQSKLKKQWGVGGVCVNKNTMYLKFNDGQKSTVMKLNYKEKSIWD